MASAGEVSTLPYSATCDACEPDEAKEANVICEECQFSFCEVHAEEHLEQYLGHQLRDYDEVLAEEESNPRASSSKHRASDRKNCPLHRQELSLYCKDDSQIICVLCAVAGDHRQHELITLNQAYLEMKNRKSVDLKGAMGEMIEKLKEKCANPKITRGELKTFIQKEFKHLKQLVNEEEKKALHFVDLQEAVASAHVTEVLAELNVHMGKLMTEMAEITRQLNSFDQTDSDDESREEESEPDQTAESASASRFQSPPPGNGPW